MVGINLIELMEKLLTISQVAEVLQVSRSLIYKWVHYDFVPHIKIGNVLRFRESELIRWIKRRSQNGRNSQKINIENFN